MRMCDGNQEILDKKMLYSTAVRPNAARVPTQLEMATGRIRDG
jgi:hypothetical protein